MPVDNLTRRFSFNVGGHLARLCARRLFGDRQLRFKRRLVESAAPLDQAPVEGVSSLHLSSLATTVSEVQRALAP